MEDAAFDVSQSDERTTSVVEKSTHPRETAPYITFGSPSIGSEEIAAVTAVLESRWLGTGPKVKEFEQAMCAYVGADHAAALGSCTAALHLALCVAGVGPGDEVITTSMTFASSANAIIHSGATPVLVDVDRRTMNIDPAAIEAAITERTKAMIVVHMAGRPCDLDAIHRIADRYDLLVIEDAAHAIEAEYKGRHIGSISPLTCYSFYVTKNMTTGEGGMIATTREDYAKRAKQYGLHGLSADAWSRFSDAGYKHYEVDYPGFKFNMTDIQASLGIVQLPKLERWLKRRCEIWAMYDEAFQDLPCITPAPEEKNTRHARHLYTLLVDTDDGAVDRDTLMGRLHRRGIGTGVHYRGVHLHRYYRERFKLTRDQFPNASWISDRTISLPLAPNLTNAQVERVIDAVRAELR